MTGERWRTRARKVVHLRGVVGNCRVATDRSRRDNAGGRKGQGPDTRRRGDNGDTTVTTTSEQQTDTSCNIAVIHAQLHRPNRLRGYGLVSVATVGGRANVSRSTQGFAKGR